MEDSTKSSVRMYVIGGLVLIGGIVAVRAIFTGNKKKQLSGFVWTKALKKKVHDDLLRDANHFEVKTRKSLKNIRYFPDGRAKWIGKAHDYFTHAFRQ